MQIIKQYLNENDHSQNNYRNIVLDNYADYPNLITKTDQYKLLESLFTERKKENRLFQFALKTISVELVYIALERDIHEFPFLLNFQHYSFIDDDIKPENDTFFIKEISELLPIEKQYFINNIESNKYCEIDRLIGRAIQSQFDVHIREIFMTLFKKMTENKWKQLLAYTGEKEDWEAIVRQLQHLCSGEDEVLVI